VKVGIIGLGYVGLPLAVAFAEAGSDVVGVDLDSDRVERLRRSESDIEDIGSDRLRAVAARFTASDEYRALAACDAIVICVPTPLTGHREPDLSYLVGAASALSRVLHEGRLVVVESTTYPGTTRERLKPILEESGLAAGTDFNLAFSPERIDPGRTDYTIKTTPKIVGGLTDACRERAAALYREICDEVVEVSTLEAAELSKLLENIFRSVNIALVNELAMLCHRLGIDIWEVIDAASTKPFGFMRFEPGPGMGGHCLPVDAALNDVRKPLRGSDILLLGVSYKAGVGDLRESPALKIIKLLRERGGEVSYHDPHVPELSSFGLSSVELQDAVRAADIVCIVTAHPEIDYEQVVGDAALVLDFRGITRGMTADNLVRL